MAQVASFGKPWLAFFRDSSKMARMATRKQKRPPALYVRVPPELRDAVHAEAEEKSYKLTAWIILAIREKLTRDAPKRARRA